MPGQGDGLTRSHRRWRVRGEIVSSDELNGGTCTDRLLGNRRLSQECSADFMSRSTQCRPDQNLFMWDHVWWSFYLLCYWTFVCTFLHLQLLHTAMTRFKWKHACRTQIAWDSSCVTVHLLIWNYWGQEYTFCLNSLSHSLSMHSAVFAKVGHCVGPLHLSCEIEMLNTKK